MITHMIRELNASLVENKQRIPALSGADTAAIDEFTKMAVETKDRAAGKKYGLDYAEEFHYIGPDHSLDEYIARHAVPL